MKKPRKFCAKLLPALAALCIFFPRVALSQNQALLQELANFRRNARDPKQCLLVASPAQKNVPLYKRAKASAAVTARVEEGTHCRILETRQTRKDGMWYEIELPSEKQKQGKTAFVPLTNLITAATIHPLKEKQSFLLSFQPICEELPCQASGFLVTAQEKRAIQLGYGGLAVDRKGENIFFGRVLKKEEESGKAYWESALFRYNISGNLLTAMGYGIAPRAHPEKDWVIYRNLLGQVLVSDYSGKLSRVLYKPEENVRLYQDPSGKIAPPPKRSYRPSREGVVPPPVRLYRDPQLSEIPAAVEFMGKDQIRFQVPYDEGRVQETVQLSLEPTLF